jgi:hypothetical protein
MQSSWSYRQLTAAAERELRMLASKAADSDTSAQARRAAVAHGVYMLWHNATTQCNTMQDRDRLKALAEANGALSPLDPANDASVTVERDASYRKAAIVHMDREPTDEDLLLIGAVLNRALRSIT